MPSTRTHEDMLTADTVKHRALPHAAAARARQTTAHRSRARARAREPGTQSRRMREGRQRRELTEPNSQRVPVHWRRRPGAPPLRA
eukprot:1419430-Rhodomonas_salina.1